MMTRDELLKLPENERAHRVAGFLDGFRAAVEQVESIECGPTDYATQDTLAAVQQIMRQTLDSLKEHE